MLTLLLLALVVPTEARAEKILKFCSEGSPSAFNPQIVTDGTSFTASSRQLYNRLVEFKYGETTVEPALAESWTISPNKLKYTFKLRKGVKFHTTPAFTPSRDFNADDVLFSIDRQRDDKNAFHKVGGGSYEYFDSMDLKKLIVSVIKKDDRTIEFTLANPEAPFLANLAMDFMSVLSKEYADKMMAAGTPDKVDTDPVGTGPFTLTKYVKDNLIRYKANPTYFRGRAKIDGMVFVITPDKSVRFQKLKAGECDLVGDPAPQDLAAMRATPNVNVVDREGLNVAYLAMNTTKAPFDNKLVRQAINHALNRKSYIDAVYLGNAVVAKNPIPPTMWSYNDGVKDYGYSPEKAKALLAQAKFPTDKTYELWTMPVSRPYNPDGKKMGELMQADLAKVGVKVKLVTYDWPTYLSKSKEGVAYDLIQFGWTGDNGDPDNFLNVLLSCPAKIAGGNRANWCHKPFDDLVQKARRDTDKGARVAAYKKAQQIAKDEAPWVTIAHSKVFRGVSSKVIGYRIDPFGGDLFYNLDLK